MEIWKDIKGYEGVYQVSNLGNVKSLDRIDFLGHRLKGMARKLKCDKDGYQEVALCKFGKRKYYRVHRLVALAFIENPLNLPVVNHKDCKTSNNIFSNLEWCTIQYNVTYADAKEKMIINTDFKARELKYNRKEISKEQSKKVYQYDSHYNLVKIWSSIREAERGGFTRSSIVKCCNGKYSKHKGYFWSFDFIEERRLA